MPRKEIENTQPPEGTKPKEPTKQIGGTAEVKAYIDNKNKIVVLQLSSSLSDNKAIAELEEKYSEKFGCKVIILENILKMVDIYG